MNLTCLFCPPYREPSGNAKRKNNGPLALFSNDSNGTKNTFSFDCYEDDDECERDPSIPREIEARGGPVGDLEKNGDRSLDLLPAAGDRVSCEGPTCRPAARVECTGPPVGEANGDEFLDSEASPPPAPGGGAIDRRPLPTVPARPAWTRGSSRVDDGCGGGSDGADADADADEGDDANEDVAFDRFADENCWSEPDASSFQVRGSNYLVDRVKVSNRGPAHFRARGVDVFRVTGPEDDEGGDEGGDEGSMMEEPPTKDVGRNPNLLGGRLRDVPTFVVNFRFGWGCAVIYFEVPEKFRPFLRPAARRWRRRPRRGTGSGSDCDDDDDDDGKGRGGVPGPDDVEDDTGVVSDDDDDDYDEDAENPSMEHMHTPGERLLCQFLLDGTAERNRKLKMIPVVVDGPWAVQRVVGGKPVIIGNKVPVRYSYGPADPDAGLAEYLEADFDIDVGCSSRFMVTQITSFCLAYTGNFTMDFAFVVQGDDDDELPEHVLGAVRLQRINYLDAPVFPFPASSSAMAPRHSRDGDGAPASGRTQQEGEVFWDCDEYSLGESSGQR